MINDQGGVARKMAGVHADLAVAVAQAQEHAREHCALLSSYSHCRCYRALENERFEPCMCNRSRVIRTINKGRDVIEGCHHLYLKLKELIKQYSGLVVLRDQSALSAFEHMSMYFFSADGPPLEEIREVF